MDSKKTIVFILVLILFTMALSGCYDLGLNIEATDTVKQIETQTELETEEPKETQNNEIELNSDHKLFLEITIDTKEEDLQSIADKYGYHLELIRYNAGDSNRDPEERYMYELYDPSYFDNETAEKWRVNKKYHCVQINYYHANDDADTQYIISCVYSNGRSGEAVKQIFDVLDGSTEYMYWRQVTTAPAYKDKNWHYANSAEQAIVEYLSD